MARLMHEGLEWEIVGTGVPVWQVSGSGRPVPSSSWGVVFSCLSDPSRPKVWAYIGEQDPDAVPAASLAIVLERALAGS